MQRTGQIFNMCLSQKFLRCLSSKHSLCATSSNVFPGQQLKAELTPQRYKDTLRPRVLKGLGSK